MSTNVHEYRIITKFNGRLVSHYGTVYDNLPEAVAAAEKQMAFRFQHDNDKGQAVGYTFHIKHRTVTPWRQVKVVKP